MTVNPVYELLVEALDCADRLPLGDGSRWLADAVNSAHEVIELPEWLPQFIALVEAMDGTRAQRRGSLRLSCICR